MPDRLFNVYVDEELLPVDKLLPLWEKLFHGMCLIILHGCMGERKTMLEQKMLELSSSLAGCT